MISEKEYKDLSAVFCLPVPSIKAIDFVESNGEGFDPATGKMKIQFEPSWFKKLSKVIGGFWSFNKVDVQSKEWLAFNDAFKKDPDAAMQSTSIGRMQVMGFHYKRLGFKTVGQMWDFARESESNQLWLGLKFIETNRTLYYAVKQKEWETVAYLYNGQNYWIKGYHKKLQKAESTFLKQAS
jgi:hypothetical protein